ncbi:MULTISPECIES: ABC transporter substrate-binding protein [unclassified Salinivibrio]|uniref:ABC transporter substrate-binding protein n=1 Tax=unclassified Salinivibrio TaxID=2636825 RepID=UPI0009860278|nr:MULTISPECIES: ABC transporter substrate-binding protein [unclassified Salinivibrio]OOF12641.1 ABC transporter substrate-binding protein [Salinivibrio sp. PR919]OOF14284.1 ABC transporter substrate-binding protein [Salinivibrio sp. PR932]
MAKHLLLLLLYITLLSAPAAWAQSGTNHQNGVPQTLVIHMGELPGLIQLDGSGPFVDFVRFLDAQDPNVQIDIEVFPIHRAINGIVQGNADLMLPAVRPTKTVTDLPFAFSSESFGDVTHVLYTNKHKPLPVDVLWANPERYTIEAVPYYMPFKVTRSHSITQSLRRLAAGRIDGFVWAQEEADLILKQLGLTNIRRAHFADFQDVFVIPKGEKGEAIDAYLTALITRLRENGTLAREYYKVHRPYVDWQPE